MPKRRCSPTKRWTPHSSALPDSVLESSTASARSAVALGDTGPLQPTPRRSRPTTSANNVGQRPDADRLDRNAGRLLRRPGPLALPDAAISPRPISGSADRRAARVARPCRLAKRGGIATRANIGDERSRGGRLGGFRRLGRLGQCPADQTIVAVVRWPLEQTPVPPVARVGVIHLRGRPRSIVPGAAARCRGVFPLRRRGVRRGVRRGDGGVTRRWAAAGVAKPMRRLPCDRGREMEQSGDGDGKPQRASFSGSVLRDRSSGPPLRIGLRRSSASGQPPTIGPRSPPGSAGCDGTPPVRDAPLLNRRPCVARGKRQRTVQRFCRGRIEGRHALEQSSLSHSRLLVA